MSLLFYYIHLYLGKVYLYMYINNYNFKKTIGNFKAIAF